MSVVQGRFPPHKFKTISRCGVNGQLAFGVICAASRFRNASCDPVINTFLPSCSFNCAAASSSALQRSASVLPQSVGCVSRRSKLNIAIRIWRTGRKLGELGRGSLGKRNSGQFGYTKLDVLGQRGKKSFERTCESSRIKDKGTNSAVFNSFINGLPFICAHLA